MDIVKVNSWVPMVWKRKQNHMKHWGESLYKKGVGIHHCSLVSFRKMEATFCAARSGMHMTRRVRYLPGWLFMGKPALPFPTWWEHEAPLWGSLQHNTASGESSSLAGTTAASSDWCILQEAGAELLARSEGLKLVALKVGWRTSVSFWSLWPQAQHKGTGFQNRFFSLYWSLFSKGKSNF